MKQKGFTLIEILVAVLILGIVLTTVYASYTGTFRLIADTRSDAEVYGMARTALERMTQDLESVAPWKGSFSFVAKQSFLQDSDFTTLLFRSAAHVAFGKDEPAGGVAVIEYSVEETDKEGVFALYRSDSVRRDLEEDGETPTQKYLLCDRVAHLSYLFYDEKGDERETWDSEGGGEREKKKTPHVVEIRMELVNEKQPDNPFAFMTRVRLPVAAQK